jgi:hypothetical protein
MSAIYNSFFAARSGFYLVRLALWVGYSVLQFISKPGSRYIVPVVLAALLFLGRSELHAVLGPLLHGFWYGTWYGANSDPVSWIKDHATQLYQANDGVDPWIIDLVLFGLFVLFCVLYVLLSRMLHVVLSTFPAIGRPLPPLRRLQATKAAFSVAKVRVVVPPLPR